MSSGRDFSAFIFSKEGKIIRGSLSGEVVWRDGLGRGSMGIIGTIWGLDLPLNSPSPSSSLSQPLEAGPVSGGSHSEGPHTSLNDLSLP